MDNTKGKPSTKFVCITSLSSSINKGSGGAVSLSHSLHIVIVNAYLSTHSKRYVCLLVAIK